MGTVGSSLDSFLEKEGILDEVNNAAIKDVKNMEDGLKKLKAMKPDIGDLMERREKQIRNILPNGFKKHSWKDIQKAVEKLQKKDFTP